VPTAITVVARRKMSVVIPKRNMCPGEWNKDPLELEKRMGFQCSCVRGVGSFGNEKHAHAQKNPD
jgi:hypothetical protein